MNGYRQNTAEMIDVGQQRLKPSDSHSARTPKRYRTVAPLILVEAQARNSVSQCPGLPDSPMLDIPCRVRGWGVVDRANPTRAAVAMERQQVPHGNAVGAEPFQLAFQRTSGQIVER